MEEWRDIKGYEGLYQVSNLGRVRSLDRKVWGGDKFGYCIRQGKILKLNDHLGYKFIRLSVNANKKKYWVHRLVAETFILNPENKPQVDHIDTDASNNNVDNLRWVTQKENRNNPLTREHWLKANSGKNSKLYGIPRSEEVKEKIRNSKDDGIYVYCKELNVVFRNIHEAKRKCKELFSINVDISNISNCINGKRKSAGKYNGQRLHWTKFNKDENSVSKEINIL